MQDNREKRRSDDDEYFALWQAGLRELRRETARLNRALEQLRRELEREGGGRKARA